jgi:hypothetical protein
MKHEKQRIVRDAILIALKRDGMTPEQVLAPMMAKQLAQAEEGDTHAAAFIADRLDGKPAQQVALTGADDGPLVVEIVKFNAIATEPAEKP